MDDIFEAMTASNAGMGNQRCIKCHRRKNAVWRRSNITWAEHEEKLDQNCFFSYKKQDGTKLGNKRRYNYSLEANSIGVNKPIREYATVFDAFMTLVNVLHTGKVPSCFQCQATWD